MEDINIRNIRQEKDFEEDFILFPDATFNGNFPYIFTIVKEENPKNLTKKTYDPSVIPGSEYPTRISRFKTGVSTYDLISYKKTKRIPSFNKYCNVVEKHNSKSLSRLNTSPESTECKEYRAKFTQKQNIAKYSGKNPFRCEKCGKQFFQKGNLKTHMKLHTGEKLFKCEICGKQFFQKGNLKIHMKLHTGEKLFKCEICGREFSQKGNLKIHMKIHTAEKIFKSAASCKIFPHQDYLTKPIHTGKKAFECKECGKEFSQKCHLKTHIIIHTGDKPFKCTDCKKSYTQKHNLVSHWRTHHWRTHSGQEAV